MSENTLRRVEQACADLIDRGEPVAVATGLGRSTLYRNQRLRAAIDEHRTKPTPSSTRSHTCEPRSKPSPQQ
jgi:hypothetical protein